MHFLAFRVRRKCARRKAFVEIFLRKFPVAFEASRGAVNYWQLNGENGILMKARHGKMLAHGLPVEARSRALSHCVAAISS